MVVNKVILIGNLGQKPEMRYTSKGDAMATFSVATSEYMGKDEQTGETKTHTEWHRCVAWRRTAEVCGQFLDKGSKVYIEGKIRRREYTGQDGIKRYSFDIHVDRMNMLSPKGQRESVPDDQGYSEFPGAQSSGGGEKTPAPPDNVDVDDEFDLDEDDDEFLID